MLNDPKALRRIVDNLIALGGKKDASRRLAMPPDWLTIEPTSGCLYQLNNEPFLSSHRSLLCATTDQQMACVVPNASLEWSSSRPSGSGVRDSPGFASVLTGDCLAIMLRVCYAEWHEQTSASHRFD